MRPRIVVVIALLTLTFAEVSGGVYGQPAGSPAYVTRVVEGNVIYAALGAQIEAIRYIGVGVPFIAHPTRGSEPYAAVVTDMNRQLVEGKWIRLTFDAQPRDEHGRLLAYVWVDDVFVNAALLYRGYAEAERVGVNTRYATYFESLEADARRTGRGLWRYGDVLAHHRPRPADDATRNVTERPASVAGGRVFSSPNPITPSLVPFSPYATPSSSGAGAAVGRTGSSSGSLPTLPQYGTPRPGTTYMPVPGQR